LTRYVDTSVLVAALTSERETARMQNWLAGQPEGDLVVSEWVATEFSAALSIKLRTGQIEAGHRADALAMFARLRAENFATLPVTGVEFRTAATYADQHALGLRAGDTLHLAICGSHGATLCTLDRRLSEAGSKLGVRTTLL
jgi:predicted nucleic acid-binding protein